MPSQSPKKRRWQFSLRTLLLLPVLVAVGFYLAPRILEEFHPLREQGVLVKFENCRWVTDEQGDAQFVADLSFSADEAFELRFWHKEIGVPRSNQESQIRQFTAHPQLVGYNYILPLHLRANKDRIQIGSNETGWTESAWFPAEESGQWELTKSDLRDMSRIWSLGGGYGFSDWAFSSHDGKPERNIALWVDIDSDS